MKIALKTLGEVGAKARGIGVYTEFLLRSLSDLLKKEGHEIEFIGKGADLNGFDIVHYTSFDFFFHTLPIQSKIPVVVTVHDTIPLIYPSRYPPGIKGKVNFLLQKRALGKALSVITDSETSKKDIVSFLGVKAETVCPIYLGPTKNLVKMTETESRKVLSKYGINFPYISYVGDVNWNKNVVGLAQACETSSLHLVIVGSKAVSSDYDKAHVENVSLVELQGRFGNSKFIHRVGFVNDLDTAVLIKKSTLYCQPSFYEGFGLSVLDAMLLGVPTVCAKTQALVEIYEKASEFFDPYNVSEMAGTLKKVINSEKVQSDLIKKGLELASGFSWEKAARETLEVYKRALHHVA